MRLIIVAAGKATRLLPITNYIPKILVNTGKRPALLEIMDFWKQYKLTDVTLIIHPEFKEMIEKYWELYFPHLPLIIKTSEKQVGTAEAIYANLDESYINKQVMITWSDLIPTVKFELPSNPDYFVYVGTMEGNHRYRFEDGPNGGTIQLVTNPKDSFQTKQGNVLGLYYYPGYIRDLYKEGQDLVDVLSVDYHLGEMPVTDVLDFGDHDKLKECVIKYNDQSREFNSLIIAQDIVIKAASNKQGEAIIAKEINWYNEIQEFKNKGFNISTPNILEVYESKFIMEHLGCDSIYKSFPNWSYSKRNFVVDKMLTSLVDIHNLPVEQSKLPSPEQAKKDLKIETVDKLIKRMQEIDPLIRSFGNITHVNGQVIKPFSEVIKAIESYFSDYEYTPCLIHGDSTFCNTLWDDKEQKIGIIDPRGYFGETLLYGDPNYDYAKLLYSYETCYDLFNNSRDFHIKSIKNGNIEFDMPSYENYPNEFFKDIHKKYLIVCWLGLAQYIKNDLNKMVASYYYGLLLGTKELF